MNLDSSMHYWNTQSMQSSVHESLNGISIEVIELKGKKIMGST